MTGRWFYEKYKWNVRQRINCRNRCKQVRRPHRVHRSPVPRRNVWNLTISQSLWVPLFGPRLSTPNTRYRQRQRSPPPVHKLSCVPRRPLKSEKSRETGELLLQTICNNKRIWKKWQRWHRCLPASINTPNEPLKARHPCRIQKNRHHKRHCRPPNTTIQSETVRVCRYRFEIDGDQRRPLLPLLPQRPTAHVPMKSKPFRWPWRPAHPFYSTKCCAKWNHRSAYGPYNHSTIIPKMDEW